MNVQKHRARKKGLKVVWQVHERVPDEVFGDPVRLQQLVVILVDNAIKFTGQGEIEVGVEVEGPAAQDSVMLNFFARDTGIGVSDDKNKDIFKAFIQCDASLTRKYGGTGLGLAIASCLTKKMGGDIWFEAVRPVPSFILQRNSSAPPRNRSSFLLKPMQYLLPP